MIKEDYFEEIAYEQLSKYKDEAYLIKSKAEDLEDEK